MTKPSPSTAAWTVDLATNLASRGDILIRFAPCPGQGIEIAFVAPPRCSLEEQCLIAGEATAAIRSELRRGCAGVALNRARAGC